MRYAQCLRDQGWEVEVLGDGVRWDLPRDQEGAFNRSQEACQELVGTGLPDITEEYAGNLYDNLLIVAECVRGAGYSVAQPPSRATFVERLVASPLPMWHPYDQPAENGQLGAVEAACPIDD